MGALRRTIVLLASVAIIGTGMPAEAGRTIGYRYYEAGGAFTSAKRSDPTCEGRRRPCTLSKDGVIDAGKVEFGKLGGRKKYRFVRLRIYDDVDPAGSVRFELCQDRTGNGNCSDDKDIVYDNCSPGAPPMKVSTRYPIKVYIVSVWGCPVYFVPDALDRPGVATSGKVRLYYA